MLILNIEVVCLNEETTSLQMTQCMRMTFVQTYCKIYQY